MIPLWGNTQFPLWLVSSASLKLLGLVLIWKEWRENFAASDCMCDFTSAYYFPLCKMIRLNVCTCEMRLIERINAYQSTRKQWRQEMGKYVGKQKNALRKKGGILYTLHAFLTCSVCLELKSLCGNGHIISRWGLSRNLGRFSDQKARDGRETVLYLLKLYRQTLIHS